MYVRRMQPKYLCMYICVYIFFVCGRNFCRKVHAALRFIGHQHMYVYVILYCFCIYVYLCPLQLLQYSPTPVGCSSFDSFITLITRSFAPPFDRVRFGSFTHIHWVSSSFWLHSIVAARSLYFNALLWFPFDCNAVGISLKLLFRRCCCYFHFILYKQAGWQQALWLLDRVLVSCSPVDWLLRAYILSFPPILFCSLHVCMFVCDFRFIYFSFILFLYFYIDK